MKLDQLKDANKLAQDIEALKYRDETISKARTKLEELADVSDTVAIHIPNNNN